MESGSSWSSTDSEKEAKTQAGTQEIPTGKRKKTFTMRVVKQCNELPREVEESPSLYQLDKVLSSLLLLDLPCAGGWTS